MDENGKLTASEKKKIKSISHSMNPVVMIGKNGLTEAIVKTLKTELENHEVVKVKFQKFQDEKKEIIEELADITGSVIIKSIGNIITLYKKSEKSDSHIL